MAAAGAVAEAPATETTSAPAGRYVEARIEKIFPSKTNPRTHFADAYIDELAGSIREKGLIQPIVVRPRSVKHGARATDELEIVAGECRWRGAKKAGLALVPVIVREYSDEQVLEVQLIENIHRTDLTPLEQAVGYRKLINSNPTKHSAATIAARIGMSEAWVWDRLKLNDLIPEAKQLLEQERFSVGHAILLARLKPEDQKRALTVDPHHNNYFERHGLWRTDTGLDFDERRDVKKSGDKYAGLKPCSVRELEAWIRDHVRFDVAHAAKAQPFEFDELPKRVSEAEAKPGRGKKVVHITRSYRVADDARDDAERTFGSESWKRADGQEKSKTCEHSVLGIIVAGEDQGQSFDVCVARDKCRVHWGDVIRRKEQNAKLRDSGQTAKAEKREAAEERREQRAEQERQRKQARWNKFYPALRKAVGEAVGKLKTVNGPLYEKTLRHWQLPAGTKPADLPIAMLRDAVRSKFHGYASDYYETELVGWAKALGVDVKALEPKTEKPASGSAQKKASAKKAGKRR